MGLDGGLGAGRGAQLGEDVRHVHARRLGRDDQGGGDLPVRLPGRDEAEDLELPAGEAGIVGVAVGARPAGEVGDLRDERAGAEPLGDRRGAAQPRRRLAAWPAPPGRSWRRGSARRPPGRAGRRLPTRRRPRPRPRAGRRRRLPRGRGSATPGQAPRTTAATPAAPDRRRPASPRAPAAGRAARRRPRPVPGWPPWPRSPAAARRTGGWTATRRTAAAPRRPRRRPRPGPSAASARSMSSPASGRWCCSS